MRARKKNIIRASSDVEKQRITWTDLNLNLYSSRTNLVNVPVTELSWNLNLVGVFIHSEVNVSAEPLELHAVPLLVI